jgi:hypothetical protein
VARASDALVNLSDLRSVYRSIRVVGHVQSPERAPRLSVQADSGFWIQRRCRRASVWAYTCVAWRFCRIAQDGRTGSGLHQWNGLALIDVTEPNYGR